MSAPASHGTGSAYGPYAIGFLLAVILTALPFWAAMTGAASGGGLVTMVMGAAAVQIVVHLVCFLHLDGRSDRWTMMALVFTLFVLAILIGGSLWVMYHLNHNMMIPMEN